jgi:hypothetical protein
MKYRNWAPIIARAVEIVLSYDTAVSLRQLFYRLVAAMLLRNNMSDYCNLSTRTADARREGKFPPLADAGRIIHRYACWNGPDEAIRYAAAVYRRNRSERQDLQLYLGVEKLTLLAQLKSWFGDLGIPILAFRGYSSETYEREIAEDIAESANGRPVVILYAGDFDATGSDIVRNFEVQLNARGVKDWTLKHIALTAEQVADYNLPEAMGKPDDPRAKAFAAKHGRLCQVET